VGDLGEQRFTYAEQAREKVDQRRENTSGAAGWVADRAGEWSLDVDQSELMELPKFFWNPLMDYWFRMEIEGWEHLPDPPVLVVGVHAGAPFVCDAWTVGIQWWRRFGSDRVLHGTRLKMFPIGLSAPWGLAPSMLPEIPLPTKIRTAFQPPVEIDPDPARAGDEQYVQRKYDEVQDSLQRGMTALARRRAFPLFG
jgi:1-acyl-sn-glycerol-3-phosphate acyltransferase